MTNKIATIDIREKAEQGEKGRVYLVEGAYGNLEFIPLFGQADYRNYSDIQYVEILNDTFMGFGADETYERFIVNEAIDYLTENGIIEYDESNGEYYFK